MNLNINKNPVQVTKTATLTGHRDAVYTLEKSGDQERFFSAGADGLVVAWNLNDPENGELIAQVSGSVYALCFIPGKNQLLIGQNLKGIHVIDLAKKESVGFIALPPMAIFSLLLKPGSETDVFAALGDGTICRLDLENLKVTQVVKASDKSARCLAFNEATNQLAAGFSDHFIRIFNGDNLTLTHKLDGHTNSVFAVAFTPDNKQLITAGRDAHLRIWTVENDYPETGSIIAHMFTINHLTFSPDGKYFATCSMDKSVKVWNTANFKLLKVIDKARHAGHGTSVNKLFWTAHDNQLVSCSDDRTISVWDIKF